MKQYMFKPRDDMTVTELAEIFRVIMTFLVQALSKQQFIANDTLDLEEPLYNAMPDEVKKHFVEK